MYNWQGQLLAFKALKRHIKHYNSVRIKGHRTSILGMNQAPKQVIACVFQKLA